MNALLVTRNPLVFRLVSAFLLQVSAVRLIPCRCDLASIRAAIAICQPILLLLDECESVDDCSSITQVMQDGCPPIGLIRLGSGLQQGLDRQGSGIFLRVESPTLLADLVNAVRGLSALPVMKPESRNDFDPLRLKGLAPRERAVLDHLAQGCSSSEVAEAMGITRLTVETYRRSLCSKLGVSGSRLVRAAVISGLLAGDGADASPL